VDVGILISRAGKWYSDRVGVICAGKERTFGDIERNSNRFANGLLRECGLVKGDLVGIYADNCVEYLEVLFGVLKSGMVGVGVNAMLSANEAAFIIRDSGARVVVTSPRVANAIAAIKEKLPAVERMLCIGQPLQGMIDYEGFISKQSASRPDVALTEDDLAQLFYTGGTTGVPKGVMLTHRIVLTALTNMHAEFCHINRDDVVLSPGSLAHANGYYSLLAFINGAKLIILGGYDASEVLATIEREKVTVHPGYPVTLTRLIDHPDIRKFDLSSLRLLTYGASPMPCDKLRTALEIFGPRLTQGYGQAEALMTITFLTPEDHAAALAHNPHRLASCGKPYMTMEIRIVDEHGSDVPSGQFGEVIARGGVCMMGYWNNPEATAQTIRDGWVHTGDIGWMDDEGYVYLVDRKKDVVKTGGENVYAREVEDVLSEHPAIAEAAVVGVPDEAWGEAVKAIVVLKAGTYASADEIRRFCKQRLSSYKSPKSVEFADDLPKTPAGKISKKALRDPYWAGRDRRI